MIDFTDILKQSVKQFPKDEIMDDGERLVRAYLTAEVKDKQGDIIEAAEVKRAMNTWMDRGATMIDMHTNKPFGKGLNWREGVEPNSSMPALVLDYKVFKNYTNDNKVWEEIKSGKRTGLSIGGRSLGKSKLSKDKFSGEMGNKVGPVELYEISSVDNPANQFALNTHVNFFAKSAGDTKMQEETKKLFNDLSKGFAANDIQKPFAGFSDMNECTAKQKEKGHSDESAKRVCAFIMQTTEKQFIDGSGDTNKTKPEEKTGTTAISTDSTKAEKQPGVHEDLVPDPLDVEPPKPVKETPESKNPLDQPRSNQDMKPDDQTTDKKKQWSDEFLKECVKPKNLNRSNNIDIVKTLKTEVIKLEKKIEKSNSDGADANKADAETRLDALEKSVGTFGETLTKLVTLLERPKDPKEAKPGEEEKNPQNKKKAEDEEDKKPPEDEDKKKDLIAKPVTAAPDGGEVKLPKSTGEPDEPAKPAGEKVQVVEKKEDIIKAVKDAVGEQLKDFAKQHDLTVSTTPRPEHMADIAKSQQDAKTELALDFIKRSKEGNLTMADMNRETKDFMKGNFNKTLAKVMDTIPSTDPVSGEE